MATLLLVEDDEKIGRLLSSALAANGHATSWQRTGASALAEVQHRTFDLVVLDLGLPDVDGIEVCRRLKALQPQTVVVMLTARRDEMDVIEGLESGADDYLLKPFRLTELLARIRAHLRRGGSPTADQPSAFEINDMYVDVAARRCLVKDAELSLRPKEFDLLVRLVFDAGSAVTREALIADVWDENWFGSTKTLDVHVAALRQRMAQADPAAVVPRITTLRGYGYRLDAIA